MELQYEKDNKERIPYEYYLEKYQQADPLEISQRTQVPFDEEKREFSLKLLGVVYQVSHPDFKVVHQESSVGFYPLEDAANARILILRYLVEGHTAPSTGKFVTYSEAPSGNVYLRQFTGRCITRLAFGFGNKQDIFEKALSCIGGEKLTYGDTSYEFEFLNGCRLRMILWAGDEEFPPSAQILFSDNFLIGFHSEDLVVACDIAITMIKVVGSR